MRTDIPYIIVFYQSRSQSLRVLFSKILITICRVSFFLHFGKWENWKFFVWMLLALKFEKVLLVRETILLVLLLSLHKCYSHRLPITYLPLAVNCEIALALFASHHHSGIMGLCYKYNWRWIFHASLIIEIGRVCITGTWRGLGLMMRVPTSSLGKRGWPRESTITSSVLLYT